MNIFSRLNPFRPTEAKSLATASSWDDLITGALPTATGVSLSTAEAM